MLSGKKGVHMCTMCLAGVEGGLHLGMEGERWMLFVACVLQ